MSNITIELDSEEATIVLDGLRAIREEQRAIYHITANGNAFNSAQAKLVMIGGIMRKIKPTRTVTGPITARELMRLFKIDFPQSNPSDVAPNPKST